MQAYADAAAESPDGRLNRAPVLPEPADVDVKAVVSAMDDVRSTLLWLTSANPAGGALQLAQAEAVRAGAQIDWGRQQAVQQDTDWARAETERRVDAWLAPLVPAALASVIG